MRREDNGHARGRGGERGAALITALLVSMLLLAAGGALIYTTAMSATNAVDATAEAQAYYAAEAGLHSALSVLRGNVAKQPALKLAAGTKIKNNLRVANLLLTSNLATDTSKESRLSGWLPYIDGRVPLGTNLSFDLEIKDPDDLDRTKLTDVTYTPTRLLITSTGYGPKGAVKRMQMLFRRSAFDFDPPSTLLMAGTVSNFAIGDSKKKGYSGKDDSNAAAPPLPAFGFTDGASKTSVDTDTFDCASQACQKASASTNDPQTSTVTDSKLPAWLKTAKDTAAFLDDLQAQAVDSGRYFATKDGTAQPDIGTTDDPKFTFIDGDYSGQGGAGLLVVTGNLSFKGNTDFAGLVLVLGSYKDSKGVLHGGSLDRSGGGGGTLSGAFVVAKFDRAKPGDGFLSSSFDTSGGGNSDVVYNSSDVANALGSMGGRVAGFVEN